MATESRFRCCIRNRRTGNPAESKNRANPLPFRRRDTAAAVAAAGTVVAAAHPPSTKSLGDDSHRRREAPTKMSTRRTNEFLSRSSISNSASLFVVVVADFVVVVDVEMSIESFESFGGKDEMMIEGDDNRHWSCEGVRRQSESDEDCCSPTPASTT